MDPFLVASVVLLALLAGASLLLLRRERLLRRIRVIVGAPGGSPASLEREVTALADAVTSADRRRAAEAAELRSLVAAIPIGVLRVDEDLVVSVANPAAHAIADRAEGTMIGRSLIEAFVESRIEEVASTARVLGSGGAEVTIAGATPRALLVRARRVGSGVWVMVQDVSELRRLERIRTEFVDNLSHELRTPLANMSLLAESLARQADVPDAAVDARMRDRIGRIEIETGHLVQMVNELLDLARIESEALSPLADEVDMAALARTTAVRMTPFAERQGVVIAVDAPEALPAVRGDEHRLGQVLLNLVHNAIKFSPAGAPVTIRVEGSATTVTTSVEDHGIGIRTADQARIFERFYKVDRARVRGGGIGLGLSIARHIVEAHGGRIGVRSLEGAGSTFWFSLPVEATRAVAAAAPSVAPS